MPIKHERNSTIEFLRIASMVLVVSLHYMNASMGGGLLTNLTFNKIWIYGIESIGIMAVNIFVLISGYFLVYQKSIKLSRVVDLYVIMMFYNLVFFTIGCVIGTYSFSIKELVFAFCPFLDGRKWFMETYMIFLLIVPFLNKMILSLSDRSHKILIIIQVILFSVWPSFFPSAPITDRGYGIINFLTLYLFATYIRIHVVNEGKSISNKKLCCVFVLSCATTYISSVLPYLNGRAWDYCYFSNIFGAVSIFVLFLQMRKCSNIFINNISSATLGVYLIHATIYLQPLIYKDLMKTEKYCNSYWQLPHFMICVVIQFGICVLIDLLRQQLWKKSISKWIKNFEIRIWDEN